MGQRVFIRALGEVIGVNVRALTDDTSLAAFDKNHDGFVKRYEVPDDDTWDRVKAAGSAYIDKPMPILQLAAPALGVTAVAVIGKQVAKAAGAKSASIAVAKEAVGRSAKIGIIAATASLVKDVAGCIAEDNVSTLCLVDAAATASYAYGSAVISTAAGTAAGVAVGAATSAVATPVVGTAAGVVAGITAGAAVQMALDWVKQAVVFKLSERFG